MGKKFKKEVNKEYSKISWTIEGPAYVSWIVGFQREYDQRRGENFSKVYLVNMQLILTHSVVTRFEYPQVL